MVLSDTTIVNVSKISTFVEPERVRYRMTSRILATTGNNMHTNSTDQDPGTDTVTESMPFIIGGATAAVASIIITVISVIAICLWARRTHRVTTGGGVTVNCAHPAENAEYTEGKKTPLNEEVEPEITENDFEGKVNIRANKPAFCQTASTSADYLTPTSEIYKDDFTKQQYYEPRLVLGPCGVYCSCEPHKKIEPEDKANDCEGGFDIRANKPALCPSASTSAEYLTPMSGIYKDDSTKQQGYESRLVLRPCGVYYSCEPHKEIELEDKANDCEGGFDIRANKPVLCQSASTSAEYLTPMSGIYKDDSTKQQGYESRLVFRPYGVYYNCVPHNKIEPEDKANACERGVDIRANKPVLCPTASSSFEYLTPITEN